MTAAARRLDVTILLSSLGFLRGGLETSAIRLAEGLAGRGHGVTLVAGALPGRALPEDLGRVPVRLVRVPCIPGSLGLWRVPGRRRPGLPLDVQSRSFVEGCRLDPRARRRILGTDVTLTLLELETVLIARWRARRERPNVSWFPGGIDEARLRRDRSAVRLALSEEVAAPARAAGLRIDDVVCQPGPPASWLALPYEPRPDVRTLLFVGRLEPNKGVRELLDLFEAISPRHPGLRLLLVGEGPERPSLERRVAAARLTGRVELIGAIAPARILDELREADLFVFPSHYESFGLALVEAMAAGVPVVASNVGGIREATGDAAALVPLGRPEAWVAATERLIGDRSERARLSAAGRERAARFTAERAVELMEPWLYRAVAS